MVMANLHFCLGKTGDAQRAADVAVMMIRLLRRQEYGGEGRSGREIH
jgi:hypothetical protein